MASEYLKWKARDVKPDAAPAPMTKKEKLKNWFYYNKLWLLVGVVLLWIVGSIAWNLLGIGKVKPDHIFAYVGSSPLSDEAAEALAERFTGLSSDANGDGKVNIELRQYALNRGGDLETALYYNYAADTTLVADISSDESYFFITDDPEGVQKAYEIFASADGSPAEKGEYLVLPLGSVPGYDGKLYIARRCFYGDAGKGREADEALWETITEVLK